MKRYVAFSRTVRTAQVFSFCEDLVQQKNAFLKILSNLDGISSRIYNMILPPL